MGEEGIEHETSALFDGAPHVLVKLADKEVTVSVNPRKFRREVRIPLFIFSLGFNKVGLSEMMSLKD